ncbi:glycine betaine ABC transporter substrate-binding protein [Nocardioides aurantiacus]|uniref:Substrate binding protein of glycine betaine ABC transport system n=1 Tax=Nocardioides aurantiacus TaxID=86796 RepID=A0A3N2CPV4_9ACTN|nr:glycine betaine ABC transporter substrate-binding protein [Nocardioides aurantiacus]ROR89448.1 substrate binding protein of glycine betaine ABC transport system [Nocardioides aurantiacus]
MKNTLVAIATAATLSLVVAGCGSDSGSGSSGSGSSGGGTIAENMVFGGPPEFKTRADGIPGLEENYGVKFGKYTVTDVGGPVTVNALKRGQVDAVDLFTTDPAIEANDFVILEDPKSNFAAQNIVPIINKDKASDGVTEVLDQISEELSTDTLGDLIGQVANDKEKPEDVAKAWLADEDLDATGDSASGESLTVGSANFTENVILAEIYAQALEAQGADVTTKLNIGSREKYYPALEQGSLDLFPEYTGTILTFIDKEATATSPEDVAKALTEALPENLVALDYSEAQDSDAVVVTAETAEKFDLETIADLAKSAG